MRYTITRKIHEHFPEIKADRSGSGAHIIDTGDDWTFLLPPLIIAGILSLILCIFLLGTLGWSIILPILGVVFAVAGYSFFRRWKVYSTLHPGELFVQQWPLRRNETVRVRYVRLIKSSVMVQSISARVECMESATYQQGTDTRTVTETRYTQELESVQQKIDPERIEADWELAIPADQPPSLEVYRNHIRWSIVVSLTFAGIPADDSTFQLLVGPEVLT